MTAEERAPDPPAPAPSVKSGRASAIARSLGLAAFLIAALLLYLCVTLWNAWTSGSRHQRTDNAYLQTDLTPVATRVAGLVRAVPAVDFEAVRAGQVLVELDDDDYRATS